jgi:transcriptional regulator of met regulon
VFVPLKVLEYDFKYAYSVTKAIRLCTIVISSNGARQMRELTHITNYSELEDTLTDYPTRTQRSAEMEHGSIIDPICQTFLKLNGTPIATIDLAYDTAFDDLQTYLEELRG